MSCNDACINVAAELSVVRAFPAFVFVIADDKNKTDDHFTEVMLIRSPADEKEFKETYGVESIKVEY